MANNYLGSYGGSSCSWCYYGTCNCNYSSNNYEIVVPFEDSSISYSYPDLNYAKFFYPTPDDILPISTQFNLTHSAHGFSEPNLIHYYPISYHVVATAADHSDSAVMKQPKAAAVVIDDDDFLEYDPTPYGGGYDQILTYGEPLPASDKICHPRSTFSENSSSDAFLSGTSNVPEPLNVHGQEEETRHEIVAEMPFNLGDGSRQYHEEYGGQVVQFPPYGYGLEAMDLCESLFGYWPCLAKELRSQPKDQEEEKAGAEAEEYQCWSYAQDYIFGGPTTYG